MTLAESSGHVRPSIALLDGIWVAFGGLALNSLLATIVVARAVAVHFALTRHAVEDVNLTATTVGRPRAIVMQIAHIGLCKVYVGEVIYIYARI